MQMEQEMGCREGKKKIDGKFLRRGQKKEERRSRRRGGGVKEEEF